MINEHQKWPDDKKRFDDNYDRWQKMRITNTDDEEWPDEDGEMEMFEEDE
jgi:hypothetical protein